MDAGQGFVDTLPVYAIMPNPSPQYVVAIKLSNELLQHLQSKGTSGMTITFGNQNIITVGNEQFSFRAPPEEHGVSDCYRQVDDEEGGTFTKVGVVKRKIFVTQKLREEDRKRVKTATETHENARLSHKSVLIDATGNQLMSKDGKRKTTSSISKPPPTVIKRNRIETSSTRPQLSSLSSLASKHTTVPSKLSSPKRPPPLRSQIIQMLALEGLTHEQIEAKCHMASKTALASTLQQVAKTKDDGLYYLKKEVYTEVDTNWPGFTPEDRARVIERRALALQPDSEKKKDSEESAEGLPAPEPSALEAKATGARYPSPLPRALAAVRERPKEEKVVPARLAPPTTTTTSTSSTTAKAEAAAAAAAAAKEAAAKEAAAAAAKEAAAAAAKEKELKERERERELVRERERVKERERERQRERERERERERDLREKEKEKEKEKERERGLAGGRESSSKQQHERSPKDPSPARSSASSSAASSPSGSPASQAQAGTGSSPGKAKEEVPPPSAPRNGEHKRKRAEQPSREYNGTSSSAKGPNISMNEYKRRRVEWEKNYKEYCDLHRKLKENARFFEELGGQLKKASDAEKTKLVQRISADYQKRISRVRQWKKRFTFLHAEVKKEKAALLALHPHPS